jgi:hypothetical protein
MIKQTPYLGYPTQKAAIYALEDNGLTAQEISEKLGTPRPTVYARLAERRKARESWPQERLDKLHRIHAAALQVIAEAFGTTPKDIAKQLAPLRPAIPETIEAEPAKAAPGTTLALMPDPGVSAQQPETRPDSNRAAKPAPGRVGLRRPDGKWLTRDGKGFTDEPGEAWQGTSAAVQAARTQFANARFCKARAFGT